MGHWFESSSGSHIKMKPNKHLASLALLFLGFVKSLGRNWDKSGTDNFAHFLEMTLMCHFVPRHLSHT